MPIKLVIGLGNPGKKYEGTRHNIGRQLIDSLRPRSLPVGLLVTEGFMNASGIELAQAARYKQVKPDEILVVVDEFQIPLGQIKILKSGSDGGHNGLKSVIECLETENVPRMRIGIGPFPADCDPAQFVLKPFSSSEKKVIDQLWPEFQNALEAVVSHGIDAAMNKYNGRGLVA